MAALLAFDLALAGLLLTARASQAHAGQRPAEVAAARWFAACLATGVVTLCTPWFAAQPAGTAADLGFALCNATGFLVGPCLIGHAWATSARDRGTPGAAGGALCLLAAPCVLALAAYAVAGALGAEVRALELWVAGAKAVLLVGCAAVALAMRLRSAGPDRPFTPGRLGALVEPGFIALMLCLGLSTLPAALVGGEVLARAVHEVAVLPALGAGLWLLACLRLRGPPPAQAGTDLASPDRAADDAAGMHAPPPAREPARGERPVQRSDEEILGAVHHAFLAYLANQEGWRDPDFGLDAAARGLGIGRHLLSEAINQHVEGGFTQAVNACRMDAFRKALVAAPDHESILSIGLRCGVGSKASLQRLVRRDCGLSPSALRASLRTTGGAPPAPAHDGRPNNG